MTNRALLSAVFLLSLSCSSSSGSGGEPATGGTAGSAGSTNQAGASGSPMIANAGASPTAGASTGGGGASAAGAPATGGAASAGSAGVIGMAGAGGLASGGAAGGAPVLNGSVTQRGGDSARTSHWLAPTLTKANLSKLAKDSNFQANFSGEFASSPLFLAGATPGSGRFYVATTENDVLALDETTGATVWKHNIGGYRSNAPTCGGTPNHHGILSTPVIDAAAGVIYVAAAMADNHHEIHALSVSTGMELTSPAGWPVNLANIKAGSGLTFNAVDQNQRSALSLVDGIVYVAFGGYCGDGGNYHGWVVAVDGKDPSKTGAWATMDKQSAIWAPGGLASDGNGVFAVTGNNNSAGNNHSTSDSEELIRLTGLAVPHRDDANLFVPNEWVNPMNSADRDFGASSPTVISVPNSTPSKVIVAPSKPGRVYFLDASNLGGIQGQFAELVVASTSGQSLYTAPSTYQSASGVRVAISTGVGSVCPNGGGGDGNVMSILMQPGSTPDKPPTPKASWCAKISPAMDTVMRSPISTNSAGSADPIVWMMNGDKLNAFDGETGALLYDSGAGATPSSCVGVAKFTAPVAVNGRIVTGGSSGGQAHLCSWSVH